MAKSLKAVRIGIVSFKDDLHALVIRDALLCHEGVECHLIEANQIAGGASLTRTFSHNGSAAIVSGSTGETVRPAHLDAIWLRRVRVPQQLSEETMESHHRELLNIDCPASLLGTLATDFDGQWVNDPWNQRYAENKLVQLQRALEVELTIPRTLVSQDPHAVRAFSDSLSGRIAIKPVMGAPSLPQKTMVVDPRDAPDEVLSMCPTTYQEFIPGNVHIRAHVFGDNVYAVAIESEAVDWRFDLTVPFTQYELPRRVAHKLHALVSRLGLRMGVCDLKLHPDGRYVFFECNQQGQFLFAQALTGFDLATPFASFLLEEARSAQT